MGAFAIGARTVPMPDAHEEVTDEALVSRVKRGRTEAFSELVQRHQHTVYSLCLRYMKDPALAEDMAQESFIKGFRLLHGFRGDCRFSTWMYRVTSSVCLTELSRRGKRGEVPLDDAPQPSRDAEAGESELAEIVRHCVTRLPERYATIVTMYYLQQLPYEEIAAAMKIPVGTLKTWMFRARKELRALVDAQLGDNSHAYE